MASNPDEPEPPFLTFEISLKSSDDGHLKEAGKKIGLTFTLTKLLADHGRLPPVDGPMVSGNKRYLFAPSTLSDFVESIARSAVENAAEGRRTVALGVLLRAQRVLGLSFDTVLDLIAAGSLRPIKAVDNVTSLADLRFSRRELTRALNAISISPVVVTRAWTIRRLGANKRTYSK
jgi:hypothetical protein